ncbi:MAG: UDP-glucose 4-epimerase [Verrucomicrobiaceae bacterium]|nr:UDP-glucose 4-epimerase [Verrucomicrobiaceae bacterium]
MVTVLVTGASGFVGRVVANEAVRRGMALHGASRQDQTPVGFEGQWHAMDWNAGVEPLAALLNEVRPEVIVHAAGSASVAESLKAPLVDFQASLGSWSLLLEAVRVSGLKPVIVFPSSAAVYGNPEVLPINEDSKCHPVSPYGWHKLLCEGLAHAHASAFGAQIVVARLFSVFGAHQRRLLLWELFDRLSRDPGPLSLMGSGQETRDFLGEVEVASALIDLALLKPGLPEGKPLIVNVASGREMTTLAVAHLMTDLCAPDREVHCLGQPRPGDPLRWCADVSRLRELLPELKEKPIAVALYEAVSAWEE